MQAIYNRLFDTEKASERADRRVYNPDKEARLFLHQQFFITSARYKIISLRAKDAAASGTLRQVVFGHSSLSDVYCPAFDFFAEAEQTSFVRQAERRHGQRRADGSKADSGYKPTGCGGAQPTPKAPKKPAGSPARR